ncbi:hydroxyacid dehydrogenase, partial [Streptomyces sp. NPDC005167]
LGERYATGGGSRPSTAALRSGLVAAPPAPGEDRK